MTRKFKILYIIANLGFSVGTNYIFVRENGMPLESPILEYDPDRMHNGTKDLLLAVAKDNDNLEEADIYSLRSLFPYIDENPYFDYQYAKEQLEKIKVKRDQNLTLANGEYRPREDTIYYIPGVFSATEFHEWYHALTRGNSMGMNEGMASLVTTEYHDSVDSYPLVANLLRLTMDVVGKDAVLEAEASGNERYLLQALTPKLHSSVLAKRVYDAFDKIYYLDRYDQHLKMQQPISRAFQHKVEKILEEENIKVEDFSDTNVDFAAYAWIFYNEAKDILYYSFLMDHMSDCPEDYKALELHHDRLFVTYYFNKEKKQKNDAICNAWFDTLYEDDYKKTSYHDLIIDSLLHKKKIRTLIDIDPALQEEYKNIVDMDYGAQIFDTMEILEKKQQDNFQYYDTVGMLKMLLSVTDISSLVGKTKEEAKDEVLKKLEKIVGTSKALTIWHVLLKAQAFNELQSMVQGEVIYPEEVRRLQAYFPSLTVTNAGIDIDQFYELEMVVGSEMNQLKDQLLLYYENTHSDLSLVQKLPMYHYYTTDYNDGYGPLGHCYYIGSQVEQRKLVEYYKSFSRDGDVVGFMHDVLQKCQNRHNVSRHDNAYVDYGFPLEDEKRK